MKKLILLAMAAASLAACTDSDRRNARERQLTDQLDELARETVYFRDHAGVCWGLVWVGGVHGGPAGGPVPGVGPNDACPPTPSAPTPERP